MVGHEIFGLFFGLEGDQFIAHGAVESGADDVVGLFGRDRLQCIKIGHQHLLDLAPVIGKVTVEDVEFHHILDPVEPVGLAVHDHFGGPFGVFGDEHPANGAFGSFGDFQFFATGMFDRSSGLQEGHQSFHLLPIQRRTGAAGFHSIGDLFGAFVSFELRQFVVIAEPEGDLFPFGNETGVFGSTHLRLGDTDKEKDEQKKDFHGFSVSKRCVHCSTLENERR